MMEVWDSDAPCIINKGRAATFPDRAIFPEPARTVFVDIGMSPIRIGDFDDGRYSGDIGYERVENGGAPIYSKTKQRNPASRCVDIPLMTEHGMRSVLVEKRYFRTVTSPGKVWVEEADHPGGPFMVVKAGEFSSGKARYHP